MSEQPAVDPSESGVDLLAMARIEAGARRLVRERLRAALSGGIDDAAEQPPSDVDAALLDRIADEETERADGALLHVAVVHAVSQELGIEVKDALAHPAVDRARELLRHGHGARTDAAGAAGAAGPADADPWRTPAPEPKTRSAPAGDGVSSRAPALRQRALLLDAVHVFGIETLAPGDGDIELRFADVGIDVRKPSTDETIGRLRWDEARTVAVQRPRRGLPGRRRPALLVARTDRGEVTFELPGVSDEEITTHLEPLLARNCAGYSDPKSS